MIDLPVDSIMLTGKKFEAVGIFLDRWGKPWIWVGSHSMSSTRCWVRANKSYVTPFQKINCDIK